MRLPLNELRWLKRAALDSNRPLEHLIQRRLNREPLQYIIAFWRVRQHSANENAKLCGIPHSRFKASLCDFVHPGFPKAETINSPYDILTSNPPYITSDEYLQLR
ncbi:protein-(glutamine-n5) release factor-specific [Lentinula edodes]|uniref:Protein-(Glutamine-n5) release factor-specific n=1 Tax=Lentinula edodes TaxID=5353 RepID=A0A1Q3EAL1_LENED|nr:protein-(glutamine-n5) release factor-specific [Lentinula edodes]